MFRVTFDNQVSGAWSEIRTNRQSIAQHALGQLTSLSQTEINEIWEAGEGITRVGTQIEIEEYGGDTPPSGVKPSDVVKCVHEDQYHRRDAAHCDCGEVMTQDPAPNASDWSK